MIKAVVQFCFATGTTVLRSILAKFNVAIVKHSTLRKFEDSQLLIHDFEIMKRFAKNDFVDLLQKSKSQLRQDLFVLTELDLKRNGFFVEFGATNGVALSNTYILEKHFDWSGILAEPARVWHKELHRNRNCSIDELCVWRDSSSKLFFIETKSPEYSKISRSTNVIRGSILGSKEMGYEVSTISLEDLLVKHSAPSVIDYLSIDTEGSEYETLKAFDFSKFRFRVITCEHNFSNNREKIYLLLLKNGYRRVHEDLSLFDDWYVSETHL